MNKKMKEYQDAAGENLPYFYTLVSPGSPRKLRACLKCKSTFLSNSHGNRLCATCLVSNSRVSPKAEYIAI